MTAQELKTARKEVVVSALAIADAVAHDRMSPIELEAAAVEQCRELFGTVYGPEDPLWELHVSVVRQVLGFGGVPADELAEWTAVQRRREGKPVVEPEVSWIERALAEGGDEDDGLGGVHAGRVAEVSAVKHTVSRLITSTVPTLPARNSVCSVLTK